MPHSAESPATPGALERIIAIQVRKYRTESGLSSADLALRTGLSKAMISKVESASTSCSLTTLQRLAEGLKVPVTALFRGADTDRDATFTKSGEGSLSVRSGTQHGHEYRVLGSLKGRTDAIEPTLVTLTDASDIFPLFQHAGTEFLYMLTGKMVYGHGAYEYTMVPGDSLLLDGEGPHGPLQLLDLPITFLAITAK
ncbi:XRE family transcriptional regulator [Cryobacterium sp. TMT1-3]|uniref:XRE family transcriptional regulator n=1 Tax=Cryobacterium luteum TaxID=1424661 RepID=A0A1H8K854_9MICO|nr:MULTISPECIES: XRE family transcriptional regulator [Cryobacterium]TFB92372.1 XRE family transcriptional regulator [Cryobacterium luteum]TFC25072.1 XRE family transcriptional regulator [Cryobacterium sp. TMT1-3]SEN89143.1 transcriptional regulator, XRE family with cupin sensor [Cryobacterium luteum]